jgi:hypothetical protein
LRGVQGHAQQAAFDPPRRARVTGACVAFVTFALGFFPLALLGSLGHYGDGLPGFWSFPSGTLGDALLLPALTGCLLVVAKSLPGSSRDRKAAIAGLVIGAVAGAASQYSWLSDPHAALNWSLPRPHHFNAPGRYHAGFLIACSAAIGALWLVVLARIKAQRERRASVADVLQSGPFAFALSAGLGMCVLIARDSYRAGDTAASSSTFALVAGAAALVVATVAWAAGLRAAANAWRVGLIALASTVGLLGIVGHWLPWQPGVFAPAVAVAALAASAFTAPLRADPVGARLRWATVAASSALMLGGVARADDALMRGEPWPLIWLALGAAAGWALPSAVYRERGNFTHRRGLLLVGTYCLVAFYLAVRVRTAHASPQTAGASISVADAAFDVMVFSLIRDRFGDLTGGEKRDMDREYVTKPRGCKRKAVANTTRADPTVESDDGPRGDETLRQLFLLGVGVALSLLVLLGSAASPLGLDGTGARGNPSIWGTAVGFALIVSILAPNEVLLRRWRRATKDPEPTTVRLQLPSWGYLAPAAAAIGWPVALFASGLPEHALGYAAVASAIVGVLVCEALIQTPARLQLRRCTPAHIGLAALCGISCGGALFWLLGCGMWSAHGPLPTWRLAIDTFAVIVGSMALQMATGRMLAFGLPPRRRPEQHALDRESAQQYTMQDAANFAVISFIGLVIPLYAVGREQTLHASSLNVLASMVFIPGLVTAVLWGMKNNVNYQQDVKNHAGIPRAVLEYTGGRWKKAEAKERRRRRRLVRHIVFQNYAIGVILTLGLGYLAAVVLT